MTLKAFAHHILVVSVPNPKNIQIYNTRTDFRRRLCNASDPNLTKYGYGSKNVLIYLLTCLLSISIRTGRSALNILKNAYFFKVISLWPSNNLTEQHAYAEQKLNSTFIVTLNIKIQIYDTYGQMGPQYNTKCKWINLFFRCDNSAPLRIFNSGAVSLGV